MTDLGLYQTAGWLSGVALSGFSGVAGLIQSDPVSKVQDLGQAVPGLVDALELRKACTPPMPGCKEGASNGPDSSTLAARVCSLGSALSRTALVWTRLLPQFEMYSLTCEAGAAGLSTVSNLLHFSSHQDKLEREKAIEDTPPTSFKEKASKTMKTVRIATHALAAYLTFLKCMHSHAPCPSELRDLSFCVGKAATVCSILAIAEAAWTHRKEIKSLGQTGLSKSAQLVNKAKDHCIAGLDDFMLLHG